MAVVWMDIPASEAVRGVGYDFERTALHIQFAGSRHYAYLGVPPHEVERLLGADSVGTYVNQVIKPKYDYREVKRHAPQGPPSEPRARRHSAGRTDRERKVGPRRPAG